MNRFPFYKQLDLTDCGPTCLRMIAKYYGHSYSLNTLRDKCQIGRVGVSLLGISEAAESIGFKTLGAKLPFHKLLLEAPLPCVVHWQQKHFVVVCEFKKKSLFERFFGNHKSRKFGYSSNTSTNSIYEQYTVRVADPAKGIINYSVEEFCQGWYSTKRSDGDAGVVLLFETTPRLGEQSNEKNMSYGFTQLFQYLWQHKQLISQLLISLIVASGLQLLIPFLTQSVVDVGINTQNISFLYLVLTAQLVLVTGRLVTEFVRNWILLHVSIRINLNILSDFLIKLMRLPLSFFDSRQIGDLMQRISDHNRIETFLTGQTLNIIFSLLNLITFSIILLIYNKSIFLVFVIGSLLYTGWVIFFLKYRRELDYKRFDAAARNQNIMMQIMNGMQEIKLAGAEKSMRWKWEHLQIKLFRLQMKALSLSQYQQVGALAFNEGKNIIITFLSAEAVIKGQLTLGGMLALQYIVGQLNSPVEQLINFTQLSQDAKISLERLNEIHSIKDEESSEMFAISNILNDIHSAKSIHLRDITYQYPGAGNKPAIKNISIDIPAGKTTAIVGMSGSGKSTILKLLLKFYEPVSGDIYIGTTSLNNYKHSSWRSQCGVVMQEGFIFSDTIARNIAVDEERIDDVKLEHALLVSNLQDFVDTLPLGLNTKIGSEGNGVSQGQKQRLLIARAVYKNPSYIYFDEATNALDANNEAIIMGHLLNFFKGRTVVVVAHRLSTVIHADQIIMMDKGQVIETGTHHELTSKKGPYWNLVKNQLELAE